MKNISIFIKFIPLLISILLQYGCIDIKEKLIVNNDGSGRLEMQFVIDEKAFSIMGDTTTTKYTDSFSKEDLEELIDTCIFRLDFIKEYSKYGQRFLEFGYSFSNIFDFAKAWTNYREQDNVIERLTITQEHHLISIHWLIGGLGMNYAEYDSSYQDFHKAMFEGRYYEICIEMPSPIVKALPEEVIFDDNRKVTWKIPMSHFSENDSIEIIAKVNMEKFE